MEAQYLKIASPETVINALAARVADLENLLDYQRSENKRLATDCDRLQKDIDANAAARLHSPEHSLAERYDLADDPDSEARAQ